MGLASEAELHELDAAARAHLDDRPTIVASGLLFLTWGRKPADQATRPSTGGEMMPCALADAGRRGANEARLADAGMQICRDVAREPRTRQVTITRDRSQWMIDVSLARAEPSL